MQSSLKLGIVGLDTSHVTAFAELLNDPGHPYHIPGGNIRAAYPGVASPDFELSYARLQPYTDELANKFGVTLLDSEEAVAESCDAILLESVDGRVHLDQFRKLAPFGKPVFVDKPFALSTQEAREMIALAERYRVPLMSCSSLRYAEALSEQLRRMGGDPIAGADCYGPMAIQATQPGLFWYGIHMVEMLYRVMGAGCVRVAAETNADYDLVVGTWADGRIGTIRGNRKGNNKFGVLVHGEAAAYYADISSHSKPFYASMLEQVMRLFHTGEADIDLGETLEIIHFIECANESRETGRSVELRLNR
ncbi:Gfo/Idh/MocA family protein [Cohnella faecalis]|uniref:Gfo/Idh/MocA family oxidoreductase n=1 Tax=Cohnella faecalis TaxID=2315694 RepID=A0A398CRA5_9BACL|nr:Gfo/Idh/MocA family oxidoreductase [Cohnella faecalis]RIE05073.1 gfo/Idh/MocA family oxidoreductase [Cohnella faecalis]